MPSLQAEPKYEVKRFSGLKVSTIVFCAVGSGLAITSNYLFVNRNVHEPRRAIRIGSNSDYINTTSLNLTLGEKPTEFDLKESLDEKQEGAFRSNDIFLEKLNEKWAQFGVIFARNSNMTKIYRDQLDEERYFPLVAGNITNSNGFVGSGANGAAFLVYDKKKSAVRIAKFLKQDLPSERVDKSIKHLKAEIKFSRKWANITGYDLEAVYADGVVYKNFIYGKSLKELVKSRILFDKENEIRQQLLRFYWKIISKKSFIYDLQSENIYYSDIEKDWVIIDGGGVEILPSYNETIAEYSAIGARLLSYHLKVEQTERDSYHKQIEELVSDIIQYSKGCLDQRGLSDAS